MPRRRSMGNRRNGARRGPAAGPPPPPYRATVQPAEPPLPPPADPPTEMASIGGDRLRFYVEPGVFTRVQVEGVTTRAVAISAANMVATCNRYLHALIRENVELRSDVIELRARLGLPPKVYDPADLEPQTPVEADEDAPEPDEPDEAAVEEPYDPQPVSVIGAEKSAIADEPTGATDPPPTPD